MLARQLLVGFLVVIVPSTVLLAAVTFYTMSSLDRVGTELVRIMHSREVVTELHMTLTQTGAPLGSFLLTGNPANRERFEELVRTAEAKLASCGAVSCHGSDLAANRMAATLEPAIERLKREGRLLFEEGARGAARVETVRQTIAGVREVTDPMMKAVRVRAGELEAEAASVRWRAWVLMATLTVTIVLTGASAALLIAGRISRPIRDLLAGIRRMKAGDWSYQAGTATTGEIRELAVAFNAMIREVQEHRATLEERVRQRTEELRQKEQALAQSEKLASLGLLAAGVAHELNNPLTSIVMNTNLMLEEVAEGTAFHKELSKIDADAGRCRRIIEDLRAFARVRQVERVPGEVAAVVEEALAAVARDLDQRGVEVHRELEPGLPRVWWDSARMVQVLINLLVNAAHAADGKGRVVVRARREQEWLRLEVEDDGVGIPAVDRARIFDPFFTTKPDGTGLGLSISHGIVHEHGGRLEVESVSRADAAPGGRTGTTMRVFLPIGEASR